MRTGLVALLFQPVACWFGRHDPDSPIETEAGVLYLRCEACGRRSHGLCPTATLDETEGRRRPEGRVH